MKRRSRRLTVYQCATWLWLSATAHAGNEDEFLVGNDAALVGGAVIATVNDGGAVWYNPAGVAGSTRDQIDMTTSVYSLRLYRAEGFMQSAQGEQTDLAVSDFVTTPSQISYLRPLGGGLALGLGYYSPRASKLLLRERLDASIADLDSEWVIDGISQSSEYGFGAALGFVPVRGLRIGLGAMLRWESLTESFEVLGSIQTDDTVTFVAQVGELRTQDLIGIEPIGGVQWDVSPELTLGLSVRGPRLSLVNSGEISSRSTVVLSDVAATLVGVEAVTEEVSNTPVSLVRWGRYYVGLAYAWEDNRISVDGDIQPWLKNDDAGVRRKLQVNARIGYTRDLSKTTALGVGLFTDRSANDLEEGGLITKPGDFYGGTVGLKLSNEHLLAESERADSLVFSSVFALRYAQATAQTESLLADATAAPLEVLDVRSVDLTIREIGLYVGSGLHF